LGQGGIFMSTLGYLLRYYRQRKKLSVSGLKSVFESNNYPISISTINNYENGNRRPPSNYLTYFVKYTNLKETELKNLFDASLIDHQEKYYSEATETPKQKIILPRKKKKNRQGFRFFISYSSRDHAVASKIGEILEKEGYGVWLDQKDIVIGQPLLDRIRDGLNFESDYVLILLSKNSVKSEWCKLELRMAYEKEIISKKVVVLPIRIDEINVPDEIRVKKYFQLNPSQTDSFKMLIVEIRSLIERQYKAKKKPK